MTKNVRRTGFRLSGLPGWGCFFIALALFSLAACPSPVSEGGGEKAESAAFRIQSLEGGGAVFYTVPAQKLAEGARCRIFAEDGYLSAAVARSIAAEFDAGIYPVITGIFGDYMAKGFDVDGDGKLTLLLADIKDGYTGSGGYVAGYFDSTHLLDISNSNRMDMLVIDVNPQIPGSPTFYTTIAHELQHLINYAQHGGDPQELWLNEGLSTAAEYLYGGEQKSRIGYFNEDPAETIARGNNFFVWNGYWEKKGDLLANYATVYLFFRWLGIQGKGSPTYSAIINSAERDYRAVTQAAASEWGIAGIPPEITGDEGALWNYLLSSWMIANLVNAPAGLYGYKGKIDTQVWRFPNPAIRKVDLFPGEGIYSVLKDKSLADTLGSGPHIKYLGIDGTKENLEIGKAAPYSGKFLLTYNANPDPNSGAGAEQGFIMSYAGELPSFDDPAPAMAVSAGAARSALSSGALPASYPIGVHDLEALRAAEGAGAR
jgi:hypothetical protein